MIVTRFAPSPNGPLHLGHAYSALVAHDLAKTAGGRFVLRIEDLDRARCRAELADAYRADLEWLGLSFAEVPAQSSRLASYEAAAARLRAEGLLYPCACTRGQIAAAARAQGPEGPIYPGTCRKIRPRIDAGPDAGPNRGEDGGVPLAWRLDLAEAMRRTGPLAWFDQRAGWQQARPQDLGDVVLVRKDPGTPASYHLAVTLDDAADGVTLVTRGADLFAASHLHRLLQALLDLPVPQWHHHRLLVEAGGQKLAKRRGSPSLSDRRAAGQSGPDLARMLRRGQLPSGIVLAQGLSCAPWTSSSSC